MPPEQRILYINVIAVGWCAAVATLACACVKPLTSKPAPQLPACALPAFFFLRLPAASELNARQLPSANTPSASPPPGALCCRRWRPQAPRAASPAAAVSLCPALPSPQRRQCRSPQATARQSEAAAGALRRGGGRGLDRPLPRHGRASRQGQLHTTPCMPCRLPPPLLALCAPSQQRVVFCTLSPHTTSGRARRRAAAAAHSAAARRRRACCCQLLMPLALKRLHAPPSSSNCFECERCVSPP